MPTPSLTEKSIQQILRRRFDACEFHIFNSYIFDHGEESDYYSYSRAGYCSEIEIKCTKKDYKDDFRKLKHRLFENLQIGYYIEHRGPGFGDNIGREGVTGLPEEASGMDLQSPGNPIYAPCSHIHIYRLNEIKLPNRFYFASEPHVIEVDDVPDYAGLIHIAFGWAEIVKKAPFLHKRKLDMDRLMLNKVYAKTLRLEKELMIANCNKILL